MDFFDALAILKFSRTFRGNNEAKRKEKRKLRKWSRHDYPDYPPRYTVSREGSPEAQLELGSSQFIFQLPY